MVKHKNTRRLQFDTKTRKRIIERDNGECIFCRMGYTTEGATWLDLQIDGIMHFVPRSQQGLGIEQNGALGCHWHHNMLDNGNKELRPDMLMGFETYLRSIYPDWKKEDLIYRKYNF